MRGRSVFKPCRFAANYQHTEAVEDDLLVEDLLYEYEHTPERIAKVKQIALNEPHCKNALVSASGDVTIVNVTVQLPEVDKTAEVQEVIAAINTMIAKYQKQSSECRIFIKRASLP